MRMYMQESLSFAGHRTVIRIEPSRCMLSHSFYFLLHEIFYIRFTVLMSISSSRALTLTMTFLYHGDPILFGRHVVASLCPYTSP